MKVLIVGGGGREHALAWAAAKSPSLSRLYCAPGNPGTAALAWNVSVDANGIVPLAEWAAREEIDLTIVGPEAYLALGIADAFAARGLAVMGPSRAAAAIEASKAFAKELMREHAIPTARYEVLTDLSAALKYVSRVEPPVVVKADGLAGGKGVAVAHSRAQAEAAVRRIMEERAFGEAGEQVVVEEFLSGEEVSLLAFADGETVLPMVSAQDHKAAYEGDRGPNTGGMGAYSPAPALTPDLVKEITARILRPTVRALSERGVPYRGVLYAGLMLTADGPRVLEFNCRFGDPEAQVVLPRLLTDLLEVCQAVAAGRLHEIELRWSERCATCVVLVAGGYPGESETGHPIGGLAAAGRLPDVLVFHAGTAQRGDDIVTAGGRVLGVTGLGDTIRASVERSYAAVELIRFSGMRYRRDIAHRALTAGAASRDHAR